MTDRAAVHRWVAGYELAWRTSGTDGLSALFTADATYAHSPYEAPVVGIHAIGTMWDDDREGPDEVFTLSTEIVAVEGDTAVVRAEVRYGEPNRQEYRPYWSRSADSSDLIQHSFWLFDTEENALAAQATFNTLRGMSDAPAEWVSCDVCEVIGEA